MTTFSLVKEVEGTALVWNESQKVVASDGARFDKFGGSVSISGNHVVVSSTYDDDKGSTSGSIYLYQFSSIWGGEQKVVASDGAAGDFFGWSVGISGNHVVVGVRADDDKGSSSGSIYLYEYDGSIWGGEQKIVASDGAAGDQFGHSVSISGEHIVVGSRFDDDKGSSSGSIYLYKYDGSMWGGEQKIVASDGASGDQFGYSVSISSDHVVVGGLSSGAVYLYKYDTSSITWGGEQKIMASDGTAGDRFGLSVGISDGHVVVGASGDGDNNSLYSGSVYVYKYDGSLWGGEQKVVASDGTAGDKFGYSVSMSGNNVVVGSTGDDNKGSIYIYTYDGTSWGGEQKIVASDGDTSDMFGCCVSMSGNQVVVASPDDDDNGLASGAVYFVSYVKNVVSCKSYPLLFHCSSL